MGIIVGATLSASAVFGQAYSGREFCVMPLWTGKLSNHLVNPVVHNYKINGVEYHSHSYNLVGDNKADMMTFFELDENGKPKDHPEKPKFYLFDDGDGIPSLDELCEKGFEGRDPVFYKVKEENLSKPKRKMI